MPRLQKRELIPKESLLFSRNALIKLMIPLILQQVLNVLVATVDSIMVAHAGEAAVSGVSLVSTLDVLLMVFFTSLIGGGAVVVAQALGRKEIKTANEAAKQLLYISTGVASALSILVLLFRGPLLSLLFGDVEPAVMESAQGYFLFIAISFPFLAISESVSACLRSAGDTIISLWVSVVVNILNVIGNAILIYSLEMGAMGAAISTAASRFLGAVILLALFHRKKYEVYIERLLHYKPDRRIIRHILHIGVPNGVENSMFQFGKLLTQTLVSTMGTAVIAANAVSSTLCYYQYMVGGACSAAIIAIVGRCIGAGDEPQAKYYTRTLLRFNYLSIWIIAVITVVLADPLIALYELSPQSAAISKELLLLHSIGASLIWPIGFMLPSAFRAASDVRYPMFISSLSMWAFRVAGAYVLALETVSLFGLFSFPGLGLGILGVWIAMMLDWLFRALVFLWRYVSEKWLRVHHA